MLGTVLGIREVNMLYATLNVKFVPQDFILIRLSA